LDNLRIEMHPPASATFLRRGRGVQLPVVHGGIVDAELVGDVVLKQVEIQPLLVKVSSNFVRSCG
jgi:hypothetical protein